MKSKSQKWVKFVQEIAAEKNAQILEGAGADEQQVWLKGEW